MTHIPIHETFNETIQGEGFWAGTPVDFIRLQGCPIGCSFCDTGYADGGKDTPRTNRSIDDLVAEVKSPRVVISGGEPFIHSQLPELVRALIQAEKKVHIETSGAFWQPIPNTDDVWVTLSPKQHLSPRYPVHPAMWLRANEIKLVISTGEEVEFYKWSIHFWSHQFVDWGYKYWAEYEPFFLRYSPTEQVFLQPEWDERDRTLSLTLDLLKQHPHYRLSLQLHKMLGVQ